MIIQTTQAPNFAFTAEILDLDFVFETVAKCKCYTYYVRKNTIVLTNRYKVSNEKRSNIANRKQRY